jgi:hypothetical protein
LNKLPNLIKTTGSDEFYLRTGSKHVEPGETESVAIRQNPGRRKNNSEICPFELCLLVCFFVLFRGSH